MPASSGLPGARPEPLPRYFWVAAAVLALSLVYLILAVAFVRPYLWPAGHGAVMAGDSRFTGGSGDRVMLVARPPEPSDHPVGATIVRTVVSGSPAARAGLREGDEIVGLRHTGKRADID